MNIESHIGNERSTTIMKAAMYYHMLMKHAIQPNREHLTKMQMDILFILNTTRDCESEQELNMTALSSRLSVSKEQTTRAIQPLIEEGLVERRRNENNRRSVFVTLSEKGAAELHKRQEKAKSAITEFLSVLSEDEVEELYQAALTTSELIGKAVENFDIKPCPPCVE